MSQQLVKKGANGRIVNVNPRSWIEAIKDKNTGQTLVEILQGFNMYFLPYNGNTSATRCLVPTMLRKKGLWITYVKYDGNVYTEWYAADEIDDKSWGDSSNWRIGNNTLVGDITISANGNWVINGTETEFKAVGEKGNTPLIRVANNRLQVSYNLGASYIDVTTNPVYTKFRWLATSGDTQANNVGRIQASIDEGKTWTNMSNDFTNNLHIKKYIGVNESLPTSGIAEGTIYAKGPYYDEGDTLNENPIYRLWVYAWKGNTLAWQDNGEFQSIAAGVVQETGNSETKVMSQKAVTDKLSELGSKVDANTFNLENVEKALIFDESTYEEVNVCENGFNDWDYGYINTNGVIVGASSGTYKYSEKIPIKKDSVITIRQIYGNTSIASLAAYTDNGTFVRECSHIGTDITVQSTPIVIDTTGYNVSYIRITYGGGFSRYDVRAFEGYAASLSLHQKIESVEKDYNNKIQKINSELIFDESTYEEVNVCENGFNDWDYGYIKPDGTIATTSSGTYKYSPIIEIKKDSVITIKQIYGNTSIASLAAYTSDNEFVRECSYIGTEITTQSAPVTINTTEYNVSYIRITYGGGFSRYDVRAFVGEEKYMQIHQKIESIENDYNTKIQDVNDKLEYSEIANQWKGKTWIAIGTSITDTNNTLAPDGTCTGKYVPYLMEYGEFSTVENRGVAGTIAGSHMLYYASHATNLANADLVTVEGFVNDWAGAKKLGKVGDTIPYHVVWSAPVWDNGGNDEDGTFAGAVYQVLTTLMTKAPKAKIILITDNTGQLIPSTGADCSREKLKNGLIQKDYTDMAISVAKYLGIEVINAGQESQINQNHPEYLIDQVHQSELGGKQFAKTIWSKLKSIQPIEV